MAGGGDVSARVGVAVRKCGSVCEAPVQSRAERCRDHGEGACRGGVSRRVSAGVSREFTRDATSASSATGFCSERHAAMDLRPPPRKTNRWVRACLGHPACSRKCAVLRAWGVLAKSSGAGELHQKGIGSYLSMWGSCQRPYRSLIWRSRAGCAVAPLIGFQSPDWSPVSSVRSASFRVFAGRRTGLSDHQGNQI